MKKFLLTQFLFLFLLNGFTQTNTIQVQDTMYGTAQSWRDTSFGLINKSASLIPSGYLLDYSLVDSTFNGFNQGDTITESGNIFALLSIFNLSAVNSNTKLPTSTDTLFIDAYRYQRNNNKIPFWVMIYRMTG